jgi:dephospho-CoA kinase
VACGKSSVARLFQDCGAVLIDADVLARTVVERGTPALKDIARVFGKKVLLPDGTLNRPALAKIVFSSPAKLKKLNRPSPRGPRAGQNHPRDRDPGTPGRRHL